MAVNAYNHLFDHSATYDEAGNLKTFDTFAYEYDGSRMLTRQTTPGGIDWQSIYTADDERVGTYTGQGNWRFTLRDLDGKVLREVTALQSGSGRTWTRDRDHVFRDGLLLATVEAGGAAEQFHLDHLGTPRLVTNASGATIGIHTYYPFGDELALNFNEFPSENLKFTGHERDINSISGNSLDYMHARYYSAGMGRFLSVDPEMDLDKVLPEPQLWNRYAYVGNNPIRYTDPDGQERLPCAGFAQSGRCGGVPWKGWKTESIDMANRGLFVATMLGIPLPGEALLGRAFGAIGRFLGAASEEIGLTRAILAALRSANLATRLEGEAAAALGETVTAFQKVVKGVGEVDVETTKAIVEVTGGRSPGKLDQITKLINNKALNPQGKPVVVYGPKLGIHAARTLEKAGAKVVRTLDELKAAAQ